MTAPDAPMRDRELLVMGVRELSAGYAARRFSPVEVTAALLRAVRAGDERINAFVSIDV